MQGPEASGPDALAGLPSTLRTVIGNPTTSPIGFVSTPLPTPIQSDPSLSQQQIQANLQNVFSSLSMEFSPEPMLTSGNSTGSTGKGILIGILSAFGSAAVAFIVLAIFFFFKYTRRGRIMLDRIGRPGEYDDEQAFLREEEAALESMDDLARSEYLRAKGKTGDESSPESFLIILLMACSLCPRKPSRVRANRHLPITVPRDPGKRCICLGILAGTGNCELLCGRKNRD